MCTWGIVENYKGFMVKNCEHLGFGVDMQMCCVNLCMNMCGLLVIASVLHNECNWTLLEWWGTCMHVGWVLVITYGLLKIFKCFMCVLGSTNGLMRILKCFMCLVNDYKWTNEDL